MCGKDACFVFAKGQRQSVEQSIRAIPNVTIRSNIQSGPEVLGVLFPRRAVDAVCGDQEIATCARGVNVGNFSSEAQLNAELLATLLENLQELETRNAGEAVAVNGNLFRTMDNINIVPGRKRARYLGVRFFIRGLQVSQCLS